MANKIILKKKNINEFGTYYRWYKLKSNRNMIGSSLLKTKEGVLKQFKKYLDNPRNYEYSVYDKNSGKLIGVGQIFLKKNNVGGLYVLIGDKRLRRKGYGTEILKQLIKLGFNKLKLDKLKASVIGYNKASMNLFRKLGFKLVKIKKKSWRYDKKRYDEYVFEMQP